MKIARKFMLALLAGVFLIHGAAGLYRLNRERALFENDVAEDTGVIGRALGDAIQMLWETQGEDAARQVLQQAAAYEDNVDLRWVWLDERPAESAMGALTPEQVRTLRQGRSVTLETAPAPYSVLTYVPVRVAGDRLGLIEVAAALEEERAYMKQSVTNVAVATILLALVCAALSWALGARLVGRPIRLVMDQARAVGRGELDRRLNLPATDEVGELASEIDQMCDRLQAARARVETETASRIAAVDQLRHADRLKTVGTLASGVAHELGTPINVIGGHADLIREDAAATDEMKDSAEVIARQCRRMSATIRHLLDFSRRGASKDGRARAIEVVETTVAMLAPLAKKRGVEMVTRGESDPTVAMTFEQLQQVVANLSMNALHAMPEGGTLLITVDQERDPSGRSWATISVSDTGVGMTPDVVDRVFEPFFTTKDVGEGTGLGLAVVHGIVDDHGGHFSIDSSVGTGSTFVVHLPATSVP